VAIHSVALTLIVAAAYLSVGPVPVHPPATGFVDTTSVHPSPLSARVPASPGQANPAGAAAGRPPAAEGAPRVTDAGDRRVQGPGHPRGPNRGTAVPEPIRVAQTPSSPHPAADVVPPSRVSTVEPVYPEDALQAGSEGRVVLEVIVNRKGEVADVDVVSGDPLFDQAAVEAVRRWRYAPAILNGKPIDVSMTVVVEFNLA